MENLTNMNTPTTPAHQDQKDENLMCFICKMYEIPDKEKTRVGQEPNKNNVSILNKLFTQFQLKNTLSAYGNNGENAAYICDDCNLYVSQAGDCWNTIEKLKSDLNGLHKKLIPMLDKDIEKQRPNNTKPKRVPVPKTEKQLKSEESDEFEKNEQPKITANSINQASKKNFPYFVVFEDEVENIEKEKENKRGRGRKSAKATPKSTRPPSKRIKEQKGNNKIIKTEKEPEEVEKEVTIQYCPHSGCNLQFDEYSKLLSHYSVHAEQYYGCSWGKCQARFQNESDLQAHFNTNHAKNLQGRY